MKWLCFILSLYVVLLSVRPCCTDDDCNGKVSTEQTTQISNPADADDCASCSPFYCCGSCAVCIAQPLFTQQFNTIADHIITYTTYRQPFVKDVARSIWQPPKLG